MNTRDKTATSPTLTLDDFRGFMNHVNKTCRGIGCGFVRRDCRARAMSQWLRTWADGDRAKLRLLPHLRTQFNEHLPDYFRNYSEHDRAIEDEGAFARVHTRIIAALA